jgi:hypothetical protein
MNHPVYAAVNTTYTSLTEVSATFLSSPHAENFYGRLSYRIFTLEKCMNLLLFGSA